MTHKAGYISIIGSPNVGKSTLMNAMLDQKLSIISPKAQTTRHRILGILNTDDYQIVFSDTPGVIKPKYKMQESMMNFVKESLTDADGFIFLTDMLEENPDIEAIEKIIKTKKPIITVINKIDISEQQLVKEKITFFEKLIPNSKVIPISALHKANLTAVLQSMLDIIPEHEPYFPKDELSDRSERFFVSEIIREKILMNYEQEIPYCSEVFIESFIEEEKLIRIDAIIYVSRDSQKGIIIGQAGKALKKTATEARIDMEKFLNKKVFLQMFVKVQKDWRNNDKDLKNFGYIV